jgi:hypothetical protein
VRDLLHLLQYAVYSESYSEKCFKRFNVDIRSVYSHGFDEDRIHELNERRIDLWTLVHRICCRLEGVGG